MGATAWNEALANVAWLANRPQVICAADTTPFIADSTRTPVPVTVVHDTDFMWSPGEPTRLTARTPGVYRFHGTVSVIYAAHIATHIGLYLVKNGSLGLSLDEAALRMWTLNVPLSVRAEIDMAASDYVELVVFQNTGITALLDIPVTSFTGRMESQL
jgi:hypothetical protein